MLVVEMGMLEMDGWANIGGPLLLSTAIYSYQQTVDSLSTDRSNVVLPAVASCCCKLLPAVASCCLDGTDGKVANERAQVGVSVVEPSGT